MVLVSLELGGLLNNPRMPFMRWGSHISIIAILVTMFVIPHDQSTRIKKRKKTGGRHAATTQGF